MTHTYRLICIYILLFILFSFNAFSQKKALFIGNSYTYGMPELVELIAESAGESLETQHYWGGQTLNEVTSTDQVFEEIKSEDWDYVNIQEQSYMSEATLANFIQDSYPYAKMLKDSIKYYNECTQLVFYMVWAYKNGDPGRFANDTYFTQQQRDSINYQKLADTLSGICSPVGEAWKQVLSEKPWIVLHMDDESHPNDYGEYLTALVYFTVFYERSPLGLYHPVGIPDSTAEYFQEKAASVVFNNKAKWRIGVDVPNNPPLPVYPNNETLPKSLEVSLSWQSVPLADSYDVQTARDEDFLDIVHEYYNTGTNSVNMNMPEYGTKYYYRIRANYSLQSGALCHTNWTAPVYFDIPFAGPELDSPADGEECVKLKGTLEWLGATSGVPYRIQIAVDEDFTEPELDVSGHESNEYQYILKNPLSVYYWRIQEDEGAITDKWSELRSFKTTIEMPLLIAPENNSISIKKNDIAISWSSIYDSTDYYEISYNIQVSDDSGFVNILQEYTEVEDESMTFSVDEYYKDYYWRVSMNTEECISDWSETFSFRTTLPPPELLAPADSSKGLGQDLKFSWTDSISPLLFELVLSDTEYFDSLLVRKIGMLDTSTIIKNLSAGSAYYWKVRAYDLTEASPWSAVRVFYTREESPDIPNLISPADKSVKIAVDTVLQWTEVPGAQYYIVHLSGNSDFSDIDYSSDNNPSTSFMAEGLENYKVYYWRVKAAGNIEGEWSEVWQFRTIAAGLSEFPKIISPADQSEKLANPVEFSWETLDYAESYDLQIAERDDFDGELLINEQGITDITFSSGLFAPLSEYYWRIRAENEAGPGPWSDVYSFSMDDFTSVEELYVNKGITVSPNPCSGKIRISGILDPDGTITISDIQGRIHRKQAFSQIKSGQIEIGLSDLQQGVYILQISGCSGISSCLIVRE